LLIKVSDNNHISFGKRPHHSNYDGMPSGHTVAAWVPASYVRMSSKNYKYLSIPLYATAIMTGYSRIDCNAHTTSQVIVAALFSEVITFVYNKSDWHNKLRLNVYNNKKVNYFNFTLNF
tara:strand:- start:19196 stop:19552 length:357 start_codon:yes stop_codon:yes gene_type:complete